MTALPQEVRLRSRFSPPSAVPFLQSALLPPFPDTLLNREGKHRFSGRLRLLRQIAEVFPGSWRIRYRFRRRTRYLQPVQAQRGPFLLSRQFPGGTVLPGAEEENGLSAEWRGHTEKGRRKKRKKKRENLLFAFGAKKQGPEKGDGHKNPRRSQKSSDCLVEKIGKRHSP